MTDDSPLLYWYDVATGKVEPGHRRPGATLMGPYPSRAEAEQALAKARANTEAWDREDRED